MATATQPGAARRAALGALGVLLVSGSVAAALVLSSGMPTDGLACMCWVLVLAGIAGTFLASGSCRYGWLLLFGLQPLWIAYAICTAQHGLIVGCLAYGAAQLNGFLRGGAAAAKRRTK